MYRQYKVCYRLPSLQSPSQDPFYMLECPHSSHAFDPCVTQTLYQVTIVTSSVSLLISFRKQMGHVSHPPFTARAAMCDITNRKKLLLKYGCLLMPFFLDLPSNSKATEELFFNHLFTGFVFVLFFVRFSFDFLQQNYL